MSEDTRIAYGATCTWWDSIDKVGKSARGLPCCPGCRGVLFEQPDLETWMAGVRKHDATHPGYLELMEWARGRCYRDMRMLVRAYEEATGREVTF